MLKICTERPGYGEDADIDIMLESALCHENTALPSMDVRNLRQVVCTLLASEKSISTDLHLIFMD